MGPMERGARNDHSDSFSMRVYFSIRHIFYDRLLEWRTQMILIERVARAINEVSNKKFNAWMIDKDASFELARAAIEAMRDWPTIPMTDAAVNECGLAMRSHAVAVWTAMITAALREE